MKKLLLCTAALFIAFTAYAHAYSDVFTHDDYYNAVEKLGALGVINGYEDNTFRPSDLVTREQFSKMAVCAINKGTASLAMLSRLGLQDIQIRMLPAKLVFEYYLANRKIDICMLEL